MLKRGERATEFRLKATDGRLHSLADLKGSKGTAVVFSCNHCPYVRAYEDRMISLASHFQAHGIKFVLINANDAAKYPNDSFESMVQRAQEKSYPFPYLQDESQQIAKAYGAARTPEVFLLDANLKLCYHGTIDDNWEKPSAVKSHYLRSALESLLGGSEIELAETPPVGCTIKWK